jgi:hypothetical protein
MPNQNRVFIKDGAFLSPIGETSAEALHSLRQGISGIRDIKEFQLVPPSFAVSLGAPIFSASKGHFPEFKSLVTNRYNRALHSFAEKIESLNSLYGPFDSVLISYGRSSTQLLSYNDNDSFINVLGHNFIPELLLKKAGISIDPTKIIFMKSACSTGIMILNSAVRDLENKQGSRALILGIGNEICAENLLELDKVGALSHEKNPAMGCIPFHQMRSGLVMGEALVAMVLESVSVKELPGNEVFLRAGHATSDGFSLTDGLNDGSQVAACLGKTISDLDLERLDAICVHGTSTLLNDQTEMRALNAFFTKRSSPVPAFGLKPYIGHALDSSGLIETLLTSALMKEKILPPLLKAADEEEIESFYFLPQVVTGAINLVCKLSVGFGGINTAILLEMSQR